MMLFRRTIFPCCFALTVSGCIGDPIATRRLEIDHIQSIGTPSGNFVVDTSQLPRGSFSCVEETNRSGSPVSKLTIAQGQMVRILVMPANADR